MKITQKYLLVFFLGTLVVNAHEHWLCSDRGSYTAGDSITIHLRSGHSATESEFLIDTKLIREAFVIDPEGRHSYLTFLPTDLEHIASFSANLPGTYTIIANLRKRPSGPFTYLLKTEIQVGSEASKVPREYQQLEISMDGQANSFSVFSREQGVKVPILLFSPDGRSHSLIMDREGKSQFSPEASGFYVAVCHFRRQTASYCFFFEGSK